MNVYEMEGFLRGKCLPGDLKVNESNAEYLVRKLNAVSELKGELTAALATIEKCREITNCPSGVDLQGWLKKLAAENVGLKESRAILVENTLETCNEIASAGFRHEAIMRGLYKSTGNRNKHPKPITTLVDEALRKL